ncbi:MAG TPA: response regulator [Tepidisphaeraceae bacterium]|jgi:CheY-like chemotaxis protein
MNEADRKAILDKLDAADAENPAKNRRAMARVPFRKTDIACRIYHPGGSMAVTSVATRNLSAGGTSFLYHGFLHKNTKVEIVLTRRLGGEDVVAGVVTHCQHLNRAFHLIGVRFNAKIFPKLYVDPSDWNELGDGGPVDPVQLSGTVLHMDEQEMDRVLLKHHLSSTKIDLTSVATMLEATAALKNKAVDCVLCDVAVGVAPDMVIAAVRAAGFIGPIGVVTAESAPAAQKAILHAGATAVLNKPYEPQKLLSILATWLAAGAGQAERLYSTLPESPATKPLVEQFVQRVGVLVRDLRRGINGEDLKTVRAVCQTLRGTGSGFGFDALSQIAKEAVQTLDETSSVREALVHLQRLELTCRRLSVK